jgi:hypothetical protein
MLHHVMPKRLMFGRFLPPRIIFPAVLLSLAIVSAAFAQTPQDRTAEFQNKYEREKDPIRRAKALNNYGNAQVQQFVRDAAAQNMDAASSVLTAYRDEVRSVFDGLKATGNDAEKKPDGFKELEFQLRKSLWELDRVIPEVSYDRRAALQDMCDEIARVHNELFHMLFPREAGKKPGGK